MTETRQQTLTDFLYARINEDEARARAAAAVEGGDRMLASLPNDLFDGLRVAFPARVLAECEAKRRIVEQITDRAWNPSYAVRDTVLELLALPYADHPDYRDEWRPAA